MSSKPLNPRKSDTPRAVDSLRPAIALCPNTTAGPMPSVLQERARLSDLVHTNHEAIEALEKRLDVVLRPAPPTANCLAESGPFACSLASDLRAIGARLGEATERLRELLDRLEV